MSPSFWGKKKPYYAHGKKQYGLKSEHQPEMLRRLFSYSSNHLPAFACSRIFFSAHTQPTLREKNVQAVMPAKTRPQKCHPSFYRHTNHRSKNPKKAVYLPML